MRTIFIEKNSETKTLKDAQRLATWAYRIVKVCGGWHAFETADAYKTWLNQK